MPAGSGKLGQHAVTLGSNRKKQLTETRSHYSHVVVLAIAVKDLFE